MTISDRLATSTYVEYQPGGWDSFLLKRISQQDTSASEPVVSKTSDDLNVFPHPAWLDEDTAKIGDIVAIAKALGFEKVGLRLDDIYFDAQDDKDREQTMSLVSAKDLLTFIVSDQHITKPKIGLSQDGSLQAEWHVRRGRHVAMKFLGNAKVRLLAVLPAPSPGDPPDTIQKTLTLREAVAFIHKEKLLA